MLLFLHYRWIFLLEYFPAEMHSIKKGIFVASYSTVLVFKLKGFHHSFESF